MNDKGKQTEQPSQDLNVYQNIREKLLKLRINESVYVAVIVILSLVSVMALAVFMNFDNPWGLDVFRIFIITIFTILPAIMYYVFIASKKNSLFQEFVSNLHRLGLLAQTKVSSDLEENGIERQQYFNKMRILSYVDQFESVYGPVGSRLKRELLKTTECDSPNSEEFLRMRNLEDAFCPPLPEFLFLSPHF